LDGTDSAKVISYEEYHPYGATAYQAQNATIKAAAKRYRYTGMERDEESGLEYHSARYYLPWLGRWLSCDPLFKGNQAAGRNSKTAAGEDGKNRPAETMLPSLASGYKGDNKKNPDGNELTSHHEREYCRLEKTDGQEHKPPQHKNISDFREQNLPDQEELSQMKKLNLYAYCSQNPVIYQDPTGKVGIIQAWYEGYDSASTAGKVGYGFLFILAYLAHVIVNLAILIFAVFIQNLLAFWDFSYGAPQSVIGLGAGIIFTLLGADVRPKWGMGAIVEMPAYMGNPGGISFGPVVIGGHGFSDYQHEFGHTWQSRVLGPFYLLIVGIPSLISAATSSYAEHNKFFSEAWANSWAT
jgi:RHS repeat-associated protein